MLKLLRMHFCNKRRLHTELKLYNSSIKIVSETKFLGLLLKLLQFVSSTDCGADSMVLLNYIDR